MYKSFISRWAGWLGRLFWKLKAMKIAIAIAIIIIITNMNQHF
jgi:uncharacterized protein involved in cysteine biosynthesis